MWTTYALRCLWTPLPKISRTRSPSSTPCSGSPQSWSREARTISRPKVKRCKSTFSRFNRYRPTCWDKTWSFHNTVMSKLSRRTFHLISHRWTIQAPLCWSVTRILNLTPNPSYSPCQSRGNLKPKSKGSVSTGWFPTSSLCSSLSKLRYSRSF